MISKKDELFEQVRIIIGFFRKYWLGLTAVIVCMVAAGTIYAAFGVPKVYYSTGRIYIQPYIGEQSYLLDSLQVSEDLAEDCIEIVQSTPVLEEAIFSCRLQDLFTAQSLQEQMYVYTDQSRILTVTIADIDAGRAQLLTDSICKTAIKEINDIMGGKWAVLADTANFPKEQEYPILWEIILQSFVFGVSVFFLAAVIYSMQEHKIRSEEDVKKYLGVDLLGSIPQKDL